jgi:hypothetical protein
MLARVKIVKSCWRLIERENTVDERSEGNPLVFQELIETQIILLGASGNSP